MFRSFDQGIDFQNMVVRRASTLVFIQEEFVQRFEIIKRNDRKLGPFRFRSESGPEVPLTRVSRRGDEASLALFCVFTPFVFLHDSCCPLTLRVSI